MTQAYFMDPKAPLVFRNAKPFGETAVGETLGFPLPSTTAGALRTAWGEHIGARYDEATRTRLMALAAAGPLPALLKSEEVTALFPRPADALFLGEEGEPARVWRLSPGTYGDGAGSDLDPRLMPLFLPEGVSKGKPRHGPLYWNTTATGKWLSGETPDGDVSDLGIDALPVDLRTHTAIDPGSLANRDGYLFQSAGLDFGARRRPGGGWGDERYGLLARFEERFPEGWRRLGGEGRFARLRATDAWPELPAALDESLTGGRRVRLLFATPAIFADGWKPHWLDEHLEGEPPGIPGLRLRLKAAAIGRWQSVSGWDLVLKRPRAARRMVPAGAVYWFEVCAGGEQLSRLWLAPLSDHEQDRRDGFGLALPGLW